MSSDFKSIHPMVKKYSSSRCTENFPFKMWSTAFSEYEPVMYPWSSQLFKTISIVDQWLKNHNLNFYNYHIDSKEVRTDLHSTHMACITSLSEAAFMWHEILAKTSTHCLPTSPNLCPFFTNKLVWVLTKENPVFSKHPHYWLI